MPILEKIGTHHKKNIIGVCKQLRLNDTYYSGKKWLMSARSDLVLSVLFGAIPNR